MKAKLLLLLVLSAPVVLIGFFFSLFSHSSSTSEKDLVAASLFEKANADVVSGGEGGQGVGEGCCEGGGGGCGL